MVWSKLLTYKFNEKGNITVLTMGAMAGVIVMLLVMTSLFGIYINKRALQTSADAAALSAAKTLGERYTKELALLRDSRLKQFWTEVDYETAQQLGGREASGPEAKAVKDAIIDKKIGQGKLASVLKAGEVPTIKLLSMENKYGDFKENFNTRKLSELLYKTAALNFTEVGRSASAIAEKNGTGKEIVLTFPAGQKAKIIVQVKKDLSLSFFEEFLGNNNRTMVISASSVISSNDLPLLDLSGRKILKYEGFSQ